MPFNKKPAKKPAKTYNIFPDTMRGFQPVAPSYTPPVHESESKPKKNEIAAGVPGCDFCPRMADLIGKVWNNGEETEVLTCMKCHILNARPKGFKKLGNKA